MTLPRRRLGAEAHGAARRRAGAGSDATAAPRILRSLGGRPRRAEVMTREEDRSERRCKAFHKGSAAGSRSGRGPGTRIERTRPLGQRSLGIGPSAGELSLAGMIIWQACTAAGRGCPRVAEFGARALAPADCPSCPSWPESVVARPGTPGLLPAAAVTSSLAGRPTPCEPSLKDPNGGRRGRVSPKGQGRARQSSRPGP